MLPKKVQNRLRRKVRVRAKIAGTADRPRMSVFRSLLNLSVQLIDDEKGVTICAASLKDLRKGKKDEKLNVESAIKLGALIAERAKEKKVKTVVFDRSGYKYHGRIKALADAAREGGLKF